MNIEHLIEQNQSYCPQCEDCRNTVIKTIPKKFVIDNIDVWIDIKSKHCKACGEIITTGQEDQAIIDRLKEMKEGEK